MNQVRVPQHDVWMTTTSAAILPDLRVGVSNGYPPRLIHSGARSTSARRSWTVSPPPRVIVCLLAQPDAGSLGDLIEAGVPAECSDSD
jgi:hypothetical protein